MWPQDTEQQPNALNVRRINTSIEQQNDCRDTEYEQIQVLGNDEVQVRIAWIPDLQQTLELEQINACHDIFKSKHWDK